METSRKQVREWKQVKDNGAQGFITLNFLGVMIYTLCMDKV